MHSEIKIFSLFPKGQGGNVFVKTLSSSHQICWLLHTHRWRPGYVWSQVYVFCLRVHTEMCGGATTVVLTCQLVLVSEFWRKVFPTLSHLLGHDLSLLRVACCSDSIADTQTRAAPRAAAQPGALGKSLGKLLWAQPAVTRTMLMTLCWAVITYPLLLAGGVKLVIFNWFHGCSKYFFSFPH